MAETFNYQLVFDTALRPGGAEAAESAVRRVDDATARSNRRSIASDDELRRSLGATADKAKVSEFAFYDLDAAMGRTTAASQTFTTGTTQVSKASSNASRSLLLFSQGFEDAQYGIRGVLNNIPGLVMALGGTAGLAGAISIAAVASSILFEWLGKTEQKASDVADMIEEVASNMGEIESDRIQDMTQGLWDAWDAADAVRQGYEETKKASDAFSTAALSNSEKIRSAELLIAEALGTQVNLFAILDERAAREEEKRRLAAEQAIRQQQELSAAAAEQVRLAAARRETADRDLADNRIRLGELRAELGALEDINQELEKTAKKRMGWAEALATAGGFPGAVTFEADEAQKKLDQPDYQSGLKGLREKVEVLARAVEDGRSELNREVVKAENALLSAQTEAVDKQAAAAVKIEELRATLAADETLASAQLAVDQGKELAAGLKDLTGTITAGTQQQAEAKKGIEQAVADGKITADEMQELSRNLTTLLGGLQSGLSTTTGTVAAMLTQMREFQTNAAMLQREQDALKKEFESIRRGSR